MNKIKVLIAHSDSRIREELKEAIEELENVSIVDMAVTGMDTLDGILKYEPDFVFTKYDMKDMNMLDLINMVKRTLGNKSPTFKFISEDLSLNIGKKNYEAVGFDYATVKIHGKKALIEILKK